MRRDPVSEERPELRIEIAEAIASLTRGQREAFMLVEWLGVSVEEAARILRLAPASVRSRVHRARTTLRDRLNPQEGRTDG
jgi:RNA polymerase sigma-70 factor (ECF subfamily)